MATCWLSATARMAMPARLRRKNQPKAARNTRLVAAPTTWMGGISSGPRTIGASGIGSGSAFVAAPNPSAINEYMSPIRTPLDSSSAPNCQSSIRGPHGLDPDAGVDRRLPPVLVGHRRRHLHVVPARVEGVDEHRVLLGDVAPPHLP